MKIFELHKQLTLDDEEAQRMEGDKDQFLGLALDSYRSCLLTGNKYDLRVVRYRIFVCLLLLSVALLMIPLKLTSQTKCFMMLVLCNGIYSMELVFHFASTLKYFWVLFRRGLLCNHIKLLQKV